MVEQALTGHFLILSARAAIVCIRIDADAATGQEEPQHLNILGIHEANKVFHNDIDAVLMEVTVIAEGKEVKLEALRLNHALVGHIHNLYLSEVGLAGDGTQRGKLRTIELYPVVVLTMLILKSFEQRRIVIGGILCLSSQQLQVFVISWHYYELTLIN